MLTYLEEYINDINDVADIFTVTIERYNDEINDAFVDLYLESTKDKDFISKLKIFFANIISEIRRFITTLEVKISGALRDKSNKDALSELRNKVNKAKMEGKTKIEMTDFEYIRDEYQSCYNSISSLVKKFANMDYKSTTDLAEDLHTFEELMDEYDKRLSKAYDRKITVSIDKALDFIDKEKTGRTNILDSLNDLIKDVQMMKFVAEETANRKDFLQSDILKEHVSFLRKMTMKVTGFVKKHTVRTITAFTLIVG